MHALCIELALLIGVATVANKKAIFMTVMDRVPRTSKPVFHRIQLIRCAYELLGCLHLEIWRFLCSMTTRLFTLPVVRGIKMPHNGATEGQPDIVHFQVLAILSSLNPTCACAHMYIQI